ncbi:MAG: PorV/PorQ family protein [Calditrichia bacterium]
MKKISKTFIIGTFLFAAITCAPQASAVSKTATAAAQFLKIGVGPRAVALGGSFSGLANDASALYWNPAGAVWINGGHFQAMHNEWFADINHEFLGLVVPFSPAGSFGLSMISLTAPEMEQTTIEQPDGTGIYFDVQDIAIGLTYSRKLTERFSFGLTGKYVQQRIFNETATTLALDLGGMLRTGFYGMKLGIAMNNFGGKLRMQGRDLLVSYDDQPGLGGNPLTSAALETQEWPLPTSFRIGLAVDLIGPGEGFIQREAQRLTLLADGYNVNDAAETMSLGLEYSWNEYFFLRGGYRINHDLETFSAGTGIQVPLQRWMLQADYAISSMGDLGYIHRMGLGFRF